MFCWLIFLDFGLRKVKKKNNLICSFSFSLTFSFSSHPLPFPSFPLLSLLFSLIPFSSLPAGCGTFGPSCCCFYSQDWSMNPGAFSSSGPLSWAMYLMRKGRTGSGLFGKANSSLTPHSHHHHLALLCQFSAFITFISILINVFDMYSVLWCRMHDPERLGVMIW